MIRVSRLCQVFLVGAAVVAAGCHGERKPVPVISPAAGLWVPPLPAVDLPSPPAPRPGPAAVVRPVVRVLPREHHQQAIQARLRSLAGEREHLTAGAIGYYVDVQQAALQRLGGLRLERHGSRMIVTLTGASVFEVGSSRLTAATEAALAALATTLVEYQATLVSIHGHTDASGDQAYNLRLSQRRALAVADFLVARGVNLDRLVAVGHGQSKPVASNDSPEGREQNRRIELYIDPVVP